MPVVFKLSSIHEGSDSEPSEPLKKQDSIVGVWFFVVLTLCLVLWCYHDMRRLHALNTSQATTSATITDLDRNQDKRGEVDYVAYAYTVNGRQYASRDEVPYAFPNLHRKGQMIQIVYVSSDPSTSRCLGAKPEGDMTWMLVMYLCLFAFGVFTLVGSWIWPDKFNAKS